MCELAVGKRVMYRSTIHICGCEYLFQYLGSIANPCDSVQAFLSSWAVGLSWRPQGGLVASWQSASKSIPAWDVLLPARGRQGYSGTRHLRAHIAT